MHIKHKTYQHRRDFRATLICAHCGHECECVGYDDAYFHHSVIPAMECSVCGKSGGGPVSNPDVPAGVVI